MRRKRFNHTAVVHCFNESGNDNKHRVKTETALTSTTEPTAHNILIIIIVILCVIMMIRIQFAAELTTAIVIHTFFSNLLEQTSAIRFLFDMCARWDVVHMMVRVMDWILLSCE